MGTGKRPVGSTPALIPDARSMSTMQSAACASRCTGKERDTESGLDNFVARYSASSMGRFMTPDGPLIYTNKSDPQSWNLYGYVQNNPLNRVDLDGHLTIIVPGTHASGNDWNSSMKLVNEAKGKFHDDNVQILHWSGKLGSDAISEGDRCSEIWWRRMISLRRSNST